VQIDIYVMRFSALFEIQGCHLSKKLKMSSISKIDIYVISFSALVEIQGCHPVQEISTSVSARYLNIVWVFFCNWLGTY